MSNQQSFSVWRNGTPKEHQLVLFVVDLLGTGKHESIYIGHFSDGLWWSEELKGAYKQEVVGGWLPLDVFDWFGALLTAAETACEMVAEMLRTDDTSMLMALEAELHKAITEAGGKAERDAGVEYHEH